jgi:FlaA1/EpsC-like NDP-sugar epimerase
VSTRVALIRGTQVVIDLFALSAAVWLGFFIRFDWDLPPIMLRSVLFLWPYVVGLEYALLFAFGVHRYVWRYVGLREASRILISVTTATLVLIALRASVGLWFEELARHAILPYGVIAINFTLSFLGVTGVRAGRRLLSEKSKADSLRKRGGEPVRTLLIGAGQGGLLVAKEIANRPELRISPVGFLDDDLDKKGTLLHGIPVLGSIASVLHVAPALRAKQALITVSNAEGKTIRRISELCSRAGLDVKIIPGVYQLVGGEINLSRIRDVAIEDLLGRDPVALDGEAIAEAIKGRTVMITGAGGSIGSELCRQVSQFGPGHLLLVERAENALFEIHREICQAFPAQKTAACVADICDRRRMSQLMLQHRPEVVFHAAAHKHVPLMEDHPAEAVKNNVQGTRQLADLADEHGISTFVMISTDKAVRPTSVMGASKRAAEMYVQSRARSSRTKFVTVRFGNVLGSAGSVVPIFKKQIAAGGPVTVTHPDMQRYFMTIPEATQLVLQAGTMGAGGEIFILDMGEPVKIVDLARDLIRLSGFSDDEIQIEFSGVRPGEKLFEELSTAEEHANRTRHPKILVGRTNGGGAEDMERLLDALVDAAVQGSAELVRSELRRVVHDYSPEATPGLPLSPPAGALESTLPSAAAEASVSDLPSVPHGAVLPAGVTARRGSAVGLSK